MRLVTYDAGAGPRVGALAGGDTVVDLAFGGDMVAYIVAGAPESTTVPVEGARLLAPLRPRSLRDFLAFEGHMQQRPLPARPPDPGRVVRGARVLQGHAGHGDRPRRRRSRGRRGPTSSTTSSSWPR